MRKFGLVVSLICLVTLTGIPVYACRPLVLDDCPVTEKGKFSIETGASSVRGSSSDGAITETTSFKYGLFDIADIGVDIPYQFLKQDDSSYLSGMGDITVKTKISIIDYTNAWTGLSFVIGSKLANGNQEKGLGSGYVDYIVNAITTNQLGSGFIHTNIGYQIVGDKSLRNIWQYGGSFDYPIVDVFHVLGELVGSTNPDPAAESDFLATQIGFNKNFGGIIFDLGVSFGLSKASPANVYTIGLTTGF